MATGKLCVSVIEARNVVADTLAEPSFYVKMRLGEQEAVTELSRGTFAPKFLKDAKMHVVNPAADLLTVELLQVGPRGDLVVGQHELQAASISAKGTDVRWLDMYTAHGLKGAELCVVLRYLTGLRSPASSSASRSIKSGATPTSSPRPSDAAYRVARQPLSPATPMAPASPATPSAAAAAAAATGAATPPRSSAAGVPAEAATPSRQQILGLPRVSPVKKLQEISKELNNTQVPLPFAILSGVAMGALVWLMKRRGGGDSGGFLNDPLCAVGVCFNKERWQRYKRSEGTGAARL